MKFSASTVVALSVASLALLDTASASLDEAPSKQRRVLRGGRAVNTVQQEVRDLKKKGKKNEQDKKKKGNNKDNGKDNGNNKKNKKKGNDKDNISLHLNNKVEETSTKANTNRSDQCAGTKTSLTLDKKADYDNGYSWEEEALCETDEECESCCCMGGYHGWLGPDKPRRVCVWSNHLSSPANYCVKPVLEELIPTAGDDGLARN